VSEAFVSAHNLIELRLRELDTEAEHLGRVLHSLGASGPTQCRGRSPGNASSGQVTGRTPGRPCRAGFLAALENKPSTRISGISAQLAVSADQAHTLVRCLHTQQTIHKSANGYRLAARVNS